MAVPRVFISSTFYDLRYIRENLKFFIGNMGFQPVLSETGGVFYDPDVNAQDACLQEVASCQMFVLVVGGRAGSSFKGGPLTVVNHEYRKAVELKIPVFALVEQDVYSENRVYQANKAHAKGRKPMRYPSVDSTKVFDFLEEVQTNAVNNALVPFRDYSELESYLKQQWAGMMHSFLTHKSENERVTDMLTSLTGLSQQIEFLSRQILASVGSDVAKTAMQIYDLMLQRESIRSLVYLRARITPTDVLEHEQYGDLLKDKGVTVQENDPIVILEQGPQPKMSKKRFDYSEPDYQALRKEVLLTIEQRFPTIGRDEFVSQLASLT